MDSEERHPHAPFLGLCTQLAMLLELEKLAAGGRNLTGAAARTWAARSCPWPRAVDEVQSGGRLPQVRLGKTGNKGLFFRV